MSYEINKTPSSSSQFIIYVFMLRMTDDWIQSHVNSKYSNKEGRNNIV